MSASVVGTPQRPVSNLHRSGSISASVDPMIKERRRKFELGSLDVHEPFGSSVDDIGSRTTTKSIPMVGLQSGSPLQRFGIAKERISYLFENVRSMLSDSASTLFSNADVDVLRTNTALSTIVERAKAVIDDDQVRMDNISEKVRTNAMKVAFFGRTSNGKSSVINAMLCDRILPSGIGHTTSCFLCVQGTPEPAPFLMIPGTNERKSVQTVKHLAHSLHDGKLESKALVQMFWPREKCALLKNEVVLLDSPGIDINPDLDSWINTHCTDADVFVLVANAESTLMQTEKNFFHKVAQMSSKPNIFILNNRWDASASEPEIMDEVRGQHLERNLDFLADELNVISRQEGRDRVFFVSAKEALYLRMKEQNRSVGAVPLAEGYRARLQEFEAFERMFEECISSHAIKTKFGEPANTGLQVTKRLHGTLESLRTQIEDVRRQSQVELEECRRSTAALRQEVTVCANEWSQEIDVMKAKALQHVSSAMSQEIRRLRHSVQDYTTVAVFNEDDLDQYRKELCQHITVSMGEHMVRNSSQLLSEECSAIQQAMLDRFHQALPPSVSASTANIFVSPNFHVSHDVDIGEMCATFRPNLQFKFGRQWCVLLNYINGGSRLRRRSFRGSADVEAGLPSSPSSQGSGAGPAVAPAAVTAALDFTLLPGGISVERVVQLATIVSAQAPWLMIGAGVLVYRLVGWQVVAAGTAVLGGLYGYERLCWTTGAKERAYKEQMVDFATGKLEDIVTVISANSGTQVQQQLTNCKDQLCSELEVARTDLEKQHAHLERQIKQLQQVENDARSLANTAQFAESGFKDFLTGLELTVTSPSSPGQSPPIVVTNGSS